MIIDVKDLISEIDNSFWRFATKQIPFEDVIEYGDVSKEAFLKQLAVAVNEYKHSFNKPDYYYVSKEHGILRKVKVFSLEDSVIFYYCVKKIQDKLVNKINEKQGIYSAYSITSKKTLNELDKTIIDFIGPYSNGFNKYGFRKGWSDYQNKAKEAYLKSYSYYMHIDINHFYDDINLDILEKNIRCVVQDNIDLVNLLFHFLKFSDKQDLGYFPSTVGIPQEYISEMSRMLASFYLIDFDMHIATFLDEYFGLLNYEYFRYSDDMWICFNGDDLDAANLRQWSALELEKLKLHINEKKVESFDAYQYNKHWRFDDWDDIEANKHDIDYLLDLFDNIIKYDKNGRWISVVSYILKIVTSSKKNIDKYNSKKAKNLFHTIIVTPFLVEKLEKQHLSFFAALLKKYPSITKMLIDYLLSKNNIYPTIEYTLLNIFSMRRRDKGTLDFLFEYYLNHTYTKDYKWYSRCICLKYLIKNSDMLKGARLAKILAHIDSAKYIRPRKEKRYELIFLTKINNTYSNNIIKNNYSEPEDLLFLKYLNYI